MGFKIDIQGQIRNKKKYKLFAEQVLYHYFRDRVKRTIPITILFKKSIDDNCRGSCLGSRDYAYIEIAKTIKDKPTKTKTILLKPDELASTLAHELIHAKQFIRGEINTLNLMWRGEDGPLDCEGLRYRSQPWEKQAFRGEKKLTKLYWSKP